MCGCATKPPGDPALPGDDTGGADRGRVAAAGARARDAEAPAMNTTCRLLMDATAARSMNRGTALRCAATSTLHWDRWPMRDVVMAGGRGRAATVPSAAEPPAPRPRRRCRRAPRRRAPVPDPDPPSAPPLDATPTPATPVAAALLGMLLPELPNDADSLSLGSATVARGNDTRSMVLRWQRPSVVSRVSQTQTRHWTATWQARPRQRR